MKGHIILALGKWGQEDQKFRILLSYIASLGNMRLCVSQNTQQKRILTCGLEVLVFNHSPVLKHWELTVQHKVYVSYIILAYLSKIINNVKNVADLRTPSG